MIVDLPSTTTTEITRTLVRLRNDVGAMATSRVLTLVVAVDETSADQAVADANEATRQHPARIVVVVAANRRGADRIDAQIRVGGDAGASEVVVLRLYGSLPGHAESVVTPLLLADSPVVAWWPQDPPADVADSPLGRLARRRITDAASCTKPALELRRRVEHYTPGDTDLSWTRLTRWRALLAAALDQPPFEPVEAVTVTAERDLARGDLLAGWLGSALDAPVTRARAAAGTGLVSVRLQRPSGPVDLVAVSATSGTLSVPGQPVRTVALTAPSTAECLAEELRRLDADEVYAAALDGCRGSRGRRSMTRTEAVRAGWAPESPGGPPATAGPAMSTRALAGRRPTDSSPDPDAVRRRIDEELDRTDGPAPRTRVHEDTAALAGAVADAVVEVLEGAVAERGVAHLVLTGGSMGAATVAALAQHHADAGCWPATHLWWGDERYVPTGDDDRNDQQALDAGLADLGVPPEQVHRVPAAEETESAREAADRYAVTLAAQAPPGADALPVPEFDVVLLGVGPDGHVASLFPGREELAVEDRSTLPVSGSPKPPPVRVTLTLGALSRARRTWLVVAGGDKAEAVRHATGERDPQWPVSLLPRGALTWWLDRAAAQGLGA